MSGSAICRLKVIWCQHVARISTTDGGPGVSRRSKAADYRLGRLTNVQDQVIKSPENNEALESGIIRARRELKRLQIGSLVSKQDCVEYGGSHASGG